MRCLGLRIQAAAILAFLYSVSGLAAAPLPFDSTSPVIYDNDGAVESGYTDVYIMALASAGVIDLRGIISTGTNGEQPPFIPRPEDNMLLERQELVAKARRSGMRNLPDPSPGPGVSMSSRRPASGRIEDTPAVGAKGSWLIVTEARKATPSRPLVVVMGGQGSAVADAYLLDNSIADKIVVAWLVGARRTSNGILDAFEYNAYVDSWATYIIFERLRVVAFPVDGADSVPATPKSRFNELPDSEIRQYMLESRWSRGETYSEPANDWDVLGAIALTRPDFAVATKQMSFSHWETDRWGGPYQIPVWKEDPNGRTMVVWQVNAAVATDEWWSRIKDPAAWGTPAGEVPLNGTPWPVPGTIEAENFDHGGTNVGYFDNTNNWSYVEWFTEIRFLEHVDIRPSSGASGGYMVAIAEAGEWTKYSVTVASAGPYTLEARVSSNGPGGTFHVEFNGVNKTGPISIPNTGGWESWTLVTKPAIALSPGPQVMRLVMDSNGPGGQVGNFDYLKLIGSSIIADNDTGATPYTLAASPGTVVAGANITMNWTAAAPTSATDWIAFYPVQATDRSYDPTRWVYTNRQPNGSKTFIAPSAPGSYQFRYLLNNQFTSVAASNLVTVSAVVPNEAPVIQIAASANPSSVTLPAIALLSVSARDPNNGPSTLTYTWSKLSGPGTVSFSANGTPTGNVSASSFTLPGNYLLRVAISDGAASINSDVSVTVLEGGVTNATLTASPVAVAVGGTITLSWSVPSSRAGHATDWISLFSVGAPNTSFDQQRWIHTNGQTSGTYSVTAPSAAGIYEFRYLLDNGYATLAKSNNVTAAATASYTLTASPIGAAITLAWSTPPSRAGHTTDWVGLFPVGVPNTSFDQQRWIHTGGQTSGSYSVPAPSTAGDYEFRYLLDNNYSSSAASNKVSR